MKLIIFLLLLPITAKAQLISTCAGNGTLGYTGDGGLAKNAALVKPVGVNFDKNGNLLICHEGAVRRVNLSTGIISTIIGNASASTLGNGGPATNALLNNPRAICADETGNLYIADYWAVEVRKVDVSTGLISSFAGIDIVSGYSGDGGPANAAKLSGPFSICIDTTKKALYISDEFNYRIRKVDMTNGTISTFAGNGTMGFSGDGEQATNAQLSHTLGICCDHSGNLYIGDWDNARIRRVDINTGIISTIAGNGILGYSGDGNSAVNASISEVGGICFDNCENLFFSDGALNGGNYRIRRIDALSGLITTIAGNGSSGYSGDNALATNAMLSRTYGVIADEYGSIYVADIDNNRVRKIVFDTLCDGTLLSINNINKTPSITVYPNPACSEVHIDGAADDEAYRITSITGFVVQQGNLKKGTNNVDIHALPPGMYMIAVSNGGNKMVTRIIKQ